MLVKMRQRARSLDAFSHLYRDFQYRLISTYTFSESSCHSESYDMRQVYVLCHIIPHKVDSERNQETGSGLYGLRHQRVYNSLLNLIPTRTHLFLL